MAFRPPTTEGPRSFMHAVRVHQQPDATVIGFTEGVAAMADMPTLTEYMAEQGCKVADASDGPLPEYSKRFIEVRPPLSDEQIHDLGQLVIRSDFPYMPQGVFVNQYLADGPGKHVAIHY